MKTMVSAFVSVVIVSASFLASGATTYYVKPDGTGDAPTIQAAVDMGADTVLLANGIFSGAGNSTVWFYGRVVVVRSESGDPSSCEVDGRFNYDGNEPDGLLDGMTLGGIRGCCSWAHVDVVNCIFTGRSDMVTMAADFTNCEFSNLTTPIVCSQAGSASFTDCTFSNNSGVGGGAVNINWYSSATFTNCLFVGNTADVGGAIYVDQTEPFSQVFLYNCTFLDNSATRGGAIYSDSIPDKFPTPAVSAFNCSFSHNSATQGGAILLGRNTAAGFKNTIIANSVVGEGVACDSSNTITFFCSDIYGNAGGDWNEHIADQLGPSLGNISGAPLFCDPGNGDLTLDANSPCLPNGISNLCGQLIGAFGEGCGVVTGIDDSKAPQPAAVRLNSYPNPFNPVTTIAYSLPRTGVAQVRIYNVNGRLVKTLVDGSKAMGEHTVTWDGREATGLTAASGIYFVRLEHDGDVITRKILLLK